MKNIRLLMIAGLTVFAGLTLKIQALMPLSNTLRLSIGPEKIILPGGLLPFIFQSGKGTLVVQAALPEPKGYVRTTTMDYTYAPVATIRSTNTGETWQPWSPAKSQGPGPEFNGSGVELRDGTVLLIDWAAKGPDSGGDFVGKIWESYDDWKTLKGPFKARIHLPEAKAGVTDNGMLYPYLTIHRSLLEMPNGELLTTAYGWFKEDLTPSGYESRMSKTRTVLLRSVDRGRNWSLVSTIAADPTVGEEGFCEAVLLRLTQGRLKGRFIVLMRTGRITPIYQTESDDEGKTWTASHHLSFHGVAPDLIEMKGK